jgi:hypothetical protein
MGEDSDNSKQPQRLVPLRVLDGASLEGLRGIAQQLEAEIRTSKDQVRAWEDELRDIKQRISEKEEV